MSSTAQAPTHRPATSRRPWRTASHRRADTPAPQHLGDGAAGPRTQAVDDLLKGHKTEPSSDEYADLAPTPAAWKGNKTKHRQPRTEYSKPPGSAASDIIDTLTDKWVRASRTLFNAFLGKDLGLDDQASFVLETA